MSKKAPIVSKNFMDNLSDSSSQSSSIDEETLKEIKKQKKLQKKTELSNQKSILDLKKEEKVSQQDNIQKKVKKESGQVPLESEINNQQKHSIQNQTNQQNNQYSHQIQHKVNYQENPKQNYQKIIHKKDQAQHEVLIRNLPKDIDETGIQDFFGDYFEISSINLLRNRNSGQSLGISFIRLPNQIAVKKALALHNFDFRGSMITVEETRKKTTVFVKNLSFTTTEQILSEQLQNFTGVIGCRVSRDASGRNKGFAHVDFESESYAESFCKANEVIVDGRPLIRELSRAAGTTVSQNIQSEQKNDNQPIIKGQSRSNANSSDIRGTHYGGVPLQTSKEELAYKQGSISGFQGIKKKL